MFSLEDYIDQIYQLLLRNGIRSMTMDDISRELKISKKTLYQFVKDKTDLVNKAMEYSFQQKEKVIIEIINTATNPIEEIISIGKFIVGQFQSMHPSVHYDLEKYYPQAACNMMDHKNHEIFLMVISNLNKGIQQGLYRTDFDPVVIAKLFISKMDVACNQDFFDPKEFTFGKVYREMVKHHLYGVASEKGRELIKQLDWNE